MRRFAIAATALVVALVLALLLVEATLRIAWKGPEFVYVPNPWFGWSHQPGARFVAVTEGRRVDVQINEHGMRDREFPAAKPPDVFRIMVLGDSFMEALQVDRHETFTARLEEELSARRVGGGCTVQVVNAGVSAFGTDNALLYYRHAAREFRPDVVLLGFYLGNDVRNNHAPLEIADAGGARKPSFALEGGRLTVSDYPFEAHRSWTVPLRLWVNRNVWSYSLLRQSLARRRPAVLSQTTPLPLDYGLYRAKPDADWEQAWSLTQALLGELRDEVARDGARLEVMLIPSQEQVTPEKFWNAVGGADPVQRAAWDLDLPHARLTSILETLAIPHHLLLEPFRAATAGGTALYYPVDAHWLPQGHALAARLVATGLAARGELSCRSEGT